MARTNIVAFLLSLVVFAGAYVIAGILTVGVFLVATPRHDTVLTIAGWTIVIVYPVIGIWLGRTALNRILGTWNGWSALLAAMSLNIAAAIVLSEGEAWTWVSALLFLWELSIGYVLLVHRLWDRRRV